MCLLDVQAYNSYLLKTEECHAVTKKLATVELQELLILNDGGPVHNFLYTCIDRVLLCLQYTNYY